MSNPVRTAPVPTDHRRLRRMISNRESARRSRMRKQKHLEDVHSLLNRLRSENRTMSDRLAAVSDYVLLFRHDNARLRSESFHLRRRLAEIRRLMLLSQLSAPPLYGLVPGNEIHNNSSVIV